MKRSLLLSVLLLLSFFTSIAQWSTVCGSGNGFVVTFATYHGDIYSTGFFLEKCGITSNHVDKWDGTTWTPVGTGLPNAGHRLKVIDTDLYAAKYQPAADSNWLYKWNGTNFVKVFQSVYLTNAVVGFSKTANIYDVVMYRNQLVISGEFDRAGGKNISGIARWNGTSWDSLGAGLFGCLNSYNVMYPHEMLLHDTSLYVIGDFATAGGITCNGVARWDGYQWHNMGAGFNGSVYGIGDFNGIIYVGGDFTMSGTTTLTGIAKWDGTNWVNPGFGVYYSTPDLAFVHTVKQIGSYLFFTGGFDREVAGVDTFTSNAIFAYDGTNVIPLNGYMDGDQIEALEPYGNGILAGGGYNNDSSYIAKFDFAGLHVPTTSLQNIQLYPIPATDHITINGIEKHTSLIVYDILGQQIYSTTLSADKNTINTSAFVAGNYFFRFTDNKGLVTTRLVIKQ